MIRRNLLYLLNRMNHSVFKRERSMNLDKTIHQSIEGNKIISQLLSDNQPCMISRYGATELSVLVHYEKFKFKKEVFWDKNIRKNIEELSGVFPAGEAVLRRFRDLYVDSSIDIDLLGVWFKPGESMIVNKYCKKAQLTYLDGLEPYYFENPWTKFLENKRVLVIHPFEKSIQKQYQENRKMLFTNQEILPTFDLITIKAVQTIANNQSEFANWFEALKYMCSRIDEVEYDIAIIGAGAYGLPLASYVKRKGKKAIHLGGATQILFGIKGQRWDGIEKVSSLYNSYWIRPEKSEVPENAEVVEGACYW